MKRSGPFSLNYRDQVSIILKSESDLDHMLSPRGGSGSGVLTWKEKQTGTRVWVGKGMASGGGGVALWQKPWYVVWVGTCG